jgi:hypothetical protein
MGENLMITSDFLKKMSKLKLEEIRLSHYSFNIGSRNSRILSEVLGSVRRVYLKPGEGLFYDAKWFPVAEKLIIYFTASTTTPIDRQKSQNHIDLLHESSSLKHL